MKSTHRAKLSKYLSLILTAIKKKLSKLPPALKTMIKSSTVTLPSVTHKIRRINKTHRHSLDNSRTTIIHDVSIRMPDEVYMDILRQRSARRKSSVYDRETFLRQSKCHKDAIKTVTTPLLGQDIANTYRSSFKSRRRFAEALELLNRRNLKFHINETSTAEKKFICRYFWQCKGKVCARQQLCTTCRDVGKVKSCEELYYIDIMEIAQSRSILCTRCMDALLLRTVGTNDELINAELKQFRDVQGTVTPTHLLPNKTQTLQS